MILQISVDKLVNVFEIYTALNTYKKKVNADGYIRDIYIYEG
jgi:hypothetical protein